MNPRHAGFFLENMSAKFGKNSSAQPTLRGIRRVVSLDAMLKFPGRRRCIALDFSVFGDREGYWLPGPCWGQKKDASYSYLSYVCLFGLKSAKAILDHLTSDDRFVDTEEKMGGSKEYARAKEEQKHVPI